MQKSPKPMGYLTQGFKGLHFWPQQNKLKVSSEFLLAPNKQRLNKVYIKFKIYFHVLNYSSFI